MCFSGETFTDINDKAEKRGTQSFTLVSMVGEKIQHTCNILVIKVFFFAVVELNPFRKGDLSLHSAQSHLLNSLCMSEFLNLSRPTDREFLYCKFVPMETHGSVLIPASMSSV